MHSTTQARSQISGRVRGERCQQTGAETRMAPSLRQGLQASKMGVRPVGCGGVTSYEIVMNFTDDFDKDSFAAFGIEFTGNVLTLVGLSVVMSSTPFCRSRAFQKQAM